MVLIDLKDAYLGTNRGKRQKVSPVCMGGESIRVLVSPLWPQQGFSQSY